MHFRKLPYLCIRNNKNNLKPKTRKGREIMKTTANNTESREQNFFVPGMRYRCIKSVKGSFTKGKVYEQASEATDYYGWLTNNKGKRHSWPQPSNIADQCETWGFAPEDIDPREYFKSIA